MQDFVPKGTGNSRFLKSSIPENITLSEMVQMLNAGTFPVDIGGVNPAGVAQAGTPVNKSTLLTDATAAALGLSGDPTVDDALGAVGYRAGDLRKTLRTDLGDQWLLCNGEPVDKAKYPELYELVKQGWQEADLRGPDDSNTSVTSIAYGNGYWVAVGHKHGNGRAIAYATSLAGPWTERTISNNSGSFSSVAYGNGYWVVCSGSDNTIYYTTSPGGGWSTAYVTGLQYLVSVAYGNGYWVICGAQSGYIAYATAPNRTWQGISAGIFTGVNSISYGDGHWIVGGYFYNSGSTPKMCTAAIAYSEGAHPNSSWKKVNLRSVAIWSNTSNMQRPSVYSVTYANGYWAAAIIDGEYTGGDYAQETGHQAMVAYATDLASWTVLDLGILNCSHCNIAYGDGLWAVAVTTENTAVIAYATSPGGPWTAKILYGPGCAQTITYANGTWVIGGNRFQINGGVWQNYYAHIAWSALPSLGKAGCLPEIAGDGAYTYINGGAK